MVVKIPLESPFIFPSSKVTSNSSFLFSNLRFSCFNTNALYCSSRTWSWVILRVFLFRSLGFLFEGTIAFSTATSVTSSSSSASTGALKWVLSTSFAVASSAFSAATEEKQKLQHQFSQKWNPTSLKSISITI